MGSQFLGIRFSGVLLLTTTGVILCLYAHIIFEILTFLRWFGFTGNRFEGASKLFSFFANKIVDIFFTPFTPCRVFFIKLVTWYPLKT